MWQGQPTNRLMREAIALLRVGSPVWWGAVGTMIYEAAAAGQQDGATEFVRLAMTTEPGEELSGPYGMAMAGLSAGLLFLGQEEMVHDFLRRFDGIALEDPRCDRLFGAWIAASRALVDVLSVDGSTWHVERSLALIEQSIAAMESGGAIAGEAQARFYDLVFSTTVGFHERGEASGVRALALARRSGAVLTQTYVELELDAARIRMGREREAIASLERMEGRLNPHQAQMRYLFLAEGYHRIGERTKARANAEVAVGTQGPRSGSTQAAATLAQIHLADGRFAEALQLSEETPNALPTIRADLLATKALALKGLGRHEEGRAAIVEARDLLRRTFDGIRSPELKRAMASLAECARPLALARDWLGDD
jgi:hypothetical protein